MGGKPKGAQRTKNNARPSSSGRSAVLLANTNGSMLGFATLDEKNKRLANTAFNPNSCPSGQEFSLAIKKMSKKDSTTKQKGLQEFSDLCKLADVTVVKSILSTWVRLYKILVLDDDPQVREATQQTHKLIVLAVKRDIAPFLKQLIGPWFVSRFDHNPVAATTAKAAFQEAFNPMKRTQAITYCQNDILSYISQHLIVESPDSLLGDKRRPEDMLARYESIISANLLAYSAFIDALPTEELKNAQAEHKRLIFNSNKFWKFSKDSTLIKKAWFSMICTIIEKASFLLEENHKKLCNALFSNLDETDSTVLQLVWDALLFSSIIFKSWWDYVNPDSMALPKLWNVLQNGAYGNAVAIYPHILPLLHKFRVNLETREEDFYNRFFTNLACGLNIPKVQKSSSESEAIVSCFFECLRYVLKENSTKIEFCHNIVNNHLVTLFSNAVFDPAVFASSVSVFFHLSHLLRYWKKSCTRDDIENSAIFGELYHNAWSSIQSVLTISITSIEEECIKKDDLEKRLKTHQKLIWALKNPGECKLKKQLKVKFASQSEDDEIKIEVQKKSNSDTNVNVQEDFDIMVKKLLEVYYKAVTATNVSKYQYLYVNHLCGVLNSFNDKCYFKYLLTIKKDEQTNFVHYMVNNWLKNPKVSVDAVLNVIFHLLVSVKDEEKISLLEHISEEHMTNVLDICLNMVNDNQLQTAVKKWLNSSYFKSTIFSFATDLALKTPPSIEKLNVLKSCFRLGDDQMCYTSEDMRADILDTLLYSMPLTIQDQDGYAENILFIGELMQEVYKCATFVNNRYRIILPMVARLFSYSVTDKIIHCHDSEDEQVSMSTSFSSGNDGINDDELRKTTGGEDLGTDWRKEIEITAMDTSWINGVKSLILNVKDIRTQFVNFTECFAKVVAYKFRERNFKPLELIQMVKCVILYINSIIPTPQMDDDYWKYILLDNDDDWGTTEDGSTTSSEEESQPTSRKKTAAEILKANKKIIRKEKLVMYPGYDENEESPSEIVITTVPWAQDTKKKVKKPKKVARENCSNSTAAAECNEEIIKDEISIKVNIKKDEGNGGDVDDDDDDRKTELFVKRLKQIACNTFFEIIIEVLEEVVEPNFVNACLKAEYFNGTISYKNLFYLENANKTFEDDVGIDNVLKGVSDGNLKEYDWSYIFDNVNECFKRVHQVFNYAYFLIRLVENYFFYENEENDIYFASIVCQDDRLTQTDVDVGVGAICAVTVKILYLFIMMRSIEDNFKHAKYVDRLDRKELAKLDKDICRLINNHTEREISAVRAGIMEKLSYEGGLWTETLFVLYNEIWESTNVIDDDYNETLKICENLIPKMPADYTDHIKEVFAGVVEYNADTYGPLDAKLDLGRLSAMTHFLSTYPCMKLSPEQERDVWAWLDVILIQKKQIEPTYNRDLTKCLPSEIILAATVCRFLSKIPDIQIDLMTEKRMDFMMIALAYWVQSIDKTCQTPRYEENILYNMPVCIFISAVCDLVKTMTLITDPTGNEKTGVVSKLIIEWNNVFSNEAFFVILNTWRNLIESKNSENIEQYLVIRSLSELICNLRNFIKFSVKPDIICWTKSCCSAIRSPYTTVRIAAYQILEEITNELVLIDSADDYRGGVLCVQSFPFEELQRIVTGYCTGKNDVLSTLDPNSDMFVAIHSYLLIWYLFDRMCQKASVQLSFIYVTWAKDKSFLDNVLTNLFALFPIILYKPDHSDGYIKTYRSIFATRPEINTELPLSVMTLEYMACHLYYRMLWVCPLYVRFWWNMFDTKFAGCIDRITTKFVSPPLINEQLKSVKNSLSNDDNFQIRVYPPTRQIIASYRIEDMNMEITLDLPVNHPLGIAKIVGNSSVQLNGNWNAWMKNLNMYIAHQNGMIHNGLLSWKQNLDKTFEGVEECCICFAIVHNSNYELPKKSCRTCHKKFHGMCLYRWLVTSGRQTCPVCRERF